MYENNPAMFTQNLILPLKPKENVHPPNKHTKSILFILLASLPLLCFMMMYEIFLEKNLAELIKISIPSPQDFFGIVHSPIPIHLLENFTWELFQSLIFLSLMYIPLSILELISMVVTIDLASKIYKAGKPISLRKFVCRYVNSERLKGLFTTFMYVLFFSTCGFFGIICFTMTVLYTNSGFYLVDLARLAYPGVLFGLLVKYLEFSVQWNVSLVVSVLEDIYGAGAFALAFYFTKGKTKQGISLMLLFLFIGVGLRMPCFYVDDGWAGIVVRTSLLWVGNLVQWGVFMVYYHECKIRVLNKKVDSEVSEKFISDVV